MKLIPKFAAIGAAILVASAPASAIVTSWDYSVSSLFTAATYTGSGGTLQTLPSASLTWGVPNPAGNGQQSSLVIGNSPAIGTVDTYLGSSPPASPPYLGFSTSLTHNNNVINGGSTSLLTAILTNTVALDPLIPDNPAMPGMIIPFSIAFTETPNVAPCAANSPPGNPCNDIFVLTGGLLNQTFDYDDGTGLSTYFVNIFPTTGGVLSILSDSACAAAGQASGCLGFTTVEGQSTTLAFGFTISTQPLNVPEPGILALLGVGLLGLFSLRRRQ